MSKNYFKEETTRAGDLKHFPYRDFEEFKSAVQSGEIIDFGIAMDHAREWVTRSSDSPSGWRNLSTLLQLFPFLLVIFYIFMAIWTRNYWLIPYSVVPVIFMFAANPIGRKVFKVHYYFIAIYVIAAIFLKDLWSLIYWFPLVLVYLSLNQLYGGSAQIVRENLTKSERTLCLFWKWWDLVIYCKDNSKLSQRYHEKEEKTEYYEDLDKEWKEYIDAKYNKTPSTALSIEKPDDQMTPDKHCSECDQDNEVAAMYCRNCGKEL